jgi:uncharacterized glyoxalase superfamily protein PhnB
MESLSPNIFVDSMDETLDFYRSIGFQVIMTVPEIGNEFVWAMVANGDVTFMFQTFESLGEELPEISRKSGASLLFYIKIKKVRAFFELIKDKVTVLKPLDTTFYGATEFSILDNNNYVLTFAEDE